VGTIRIGWSDSDDDDDDDEQDYRDGKNIRRKSPTPNARRGEKE
jgi:hypothetical protein